MFTMPAIFQKRKEEKKSKGFHCIRLRWRRILFFSVAAALVLWLGVAWRTFSFHAASPSEQKPSSRAELAAAISENGEAAFSAAKDTKDKGVFLPVLMYHSILRDPTRWGDFVLSPEVLEEDIKYLSDGGYTAVTVSDLIQYVYEDGDLPEKPVMITFDDGYYNNVVYALPILEKYDMKATISVVGEYTETFSKANDPNPAYAHMTWTDIQQLQENGRIEIGNHTYNMHQSKGRKGAGKLWNESDEEYAAALKEDLSKLQAALLENSGVDCKVFTYPYGNISRESIPVLKEMGFLATLVCYEKPNYITREPDTLFGLNRFNRPSGISTQEFMKRVLSE